MHKNKIRWKFWGQLTFNIKIPWLFYVFMYFIPIHYFSHIKFLFSVWKKYKEKQIKCISIDFGMKFMSEIMPIVMHLLFDWNYLMVHWPFCINFLMELIGVEFGDDSEMSSALFYLAILHFFKPWKVFV